MPHSWMGRGWMADPGRSPRQRPGPGRSADPRVSPAAGRRRQRSSSRP